MSNLAPSPQEDNVDKGFKLYLANYEVMTDEGNKVPFNVRSSLVAVLFHQGLDLNALATRRNDKIATKLEECTGDYLTLTEEEYGVILNAVDTFTGYDRKATELIRRVQEAEEIKIEIKESEGV